MVKAPTLAQDSPITEGETYQDLLAILEIYISKESVQRPFLIKDGIKIIL